MENKGFQQQQQFVTHTTTTTVLQRPPSDWQFGLFGCFGDIGVCIIAYFIPCWTIGEIAEHYGESKMSVCLWQAFGGCNFVPALRAKIREERNIVGDLVNDHVYGTCCFCCSIIQMKREIDAGLPATTVAAVAMERK